MKYPCHNKFLGLLLAAFFLLSSLNLLSQNDFKEPLLLTSDSYRIYPSDVTQTEVFITKSPLDENILFTACNTLTFIPFFISEGVYTTTNGGNTWQGSDTCMGDPISFHGGDPGIVIDNNDEPAGRALYGERAWNRGRSEGGRRQMRH